jgi:hypothetical protein
VFEPWVFGVWDRDVEGGHRGEAGDRGVSIGTVRGCVLLFISASHSVAIRVSALPNYPEWIWTSRDVERFFRLKTIIHHLDNLQRNLRLTSN